MPVFSAGDVVRVPFPYTNRETTQHRPALVVSDGTLGSGLLLWTVMITSAENRRWPGDVPILEYAEAGLPFPSVVRTFKIATIESAMASAVGTISASTLETVRQEVIRHLGLVSRSSPPRRAS